MHKIAHLYLLLQDPSHLVANSTEPVPSARTSMMDLTSHKYLVEDAKFSFPESSIGGTIDEEEKGSSSISDADGGSREYKGRSGQEPASPGPFTHKSAQDGSKKGTLKVWPSCAVSLNGPSEIHSDR